MNASVKNCAAYLGNVALRALAFIAVTYMLVPLIVVVAVSFNASSRLSFPPKGFTLDWYRKFLTDPTYLASIGDSTLLALLATVIAVVLGTCVSLAIARGNFRGSATISTLMMSPLVLPNIVIGVALLQYATLVGIARSSTVLLAGHIVLIMPYVVRLMLTSLGGSSRSLEEASHDLGASAFSTFIHVILPQIKPGMVAGGLFAFVVSWVNVELSIFNVPLDRQLLPIKIFNYVQYTVDPLIAAVSASTIYVAVVIILLIDAVIGIDRFAMGKTAE